MKPIIVVLAIAPFFTNTFAKTLGDQEVPTAVKAAFHQAHPAIYDVSWTQQESDYKVEYDVNQVDVAITYEASGKIVATKTDVETATLPAAIAPYVKANYNQASINEAFKIKDHKGTITYKTDLNNTCLLFDAAGYFIKEDNK